MARVVGLIPARGGSKGIPGKNLKLLGSIPLLGWVIKAARDCRIVDTLWVSSDSRRILDCAIMLDRACSSVDAPLRCLVRPSGLAQDDTPDLPVFQHFLENSALNPDDIIVHLRPTAPFVRPSDIGDVVALLQALPRASAVRSVVRPVHHPRKMYRIDPTPFAVPVFLHPYTADHAANAPRQTLESVWAAAGYVDAIRVRTLLSGSMEGEQLLGWEAPRERAIELDTEGDWTHAEMLIAAHGWRPRGE